MKNTDTRKVEETRVRARIVLDRLEKGCRWARGDIEGHEPELAAEHLLALLEEVQPMLPQLRQALAASRNIP